MNKAGETGVRLQGGFCHGPKREQRHPKMSHLKDIYTGFLLPRKQQTGKGFCWLASTIPANNETDCFNLIDTEFKKQVMKILKELRKVIDRNADCYKKVTRNYKEEPRKIRKFICQDKN